MTRAFDSFETSLSPSFKFLYSFFLKVDEEGAEAAAFTVVQLVDECAMCDPPPPITFLVDHPFFFCILSLQPESRLRLPVFTGHCLLPVAKNQSITLAVP